MNKSNLERFKVSLRQHERCALAQLDFPTCPRGAKPALYKPNGKYVAGQTMVHRNFGAGTVIEIWEDKATVYFERCGLITLIARGLEPAPLVKKPPPPPPPPPPPVSKQTRPKPQKETKAKRRARAVSELKQKNREQASVKICPQCGQLESGQLHKQTCLKEIEVWSPEENQ